ncbi:MAG: hypothetical protein RR573_06960 [Oscillospiraceae bacterium]
MEKTSELYNLEMSKDLRGETSVNIKFGVIDVDAASTVLSIIANNNIFYSNPHSTIYECVSTKSYATFEKGRIKADGSQLVVPRTNPITQGYVSEIMSGADCVYSILPSINFKFSKTHTVKALSFTFDAAAKDYPSELIIEAWNSGKKLLSETAHPINFTFVSASAISDFDELSITFIKSNVPFRRARLSQIIFGVGITIRPEELIQLSQCSEVDPLSRRLPKLSLDFTLNNVDMLYNPENANGFWDLMGEQTPLWLSYSQKIYSGMTWGDLKAQMWATLELFTWQQLFSGGYTETINGGRYYLTAEPESISINSKFTANTVLARMTEKYLFGTLETCNLYDLAVKVLEAAELPLLDNGQKPWKLWKGLKDIFSAAPMPNKPGAECLQLIAGAACCCLYVDRLGYIRIEPLSTDVYALKLGLDTQIGSAKIEKTSTVKSVNCKYYSYYADKDATELAKLSFNVRGTASVFIEFQSPATDICVSVTGATETHDTFVYGIRLNLVGNGNADVVISGKALSSSTANAYVSISGAEENASIKTISNPLITDSAAARKIAKFVSEYVKLRISSEFAYRGNPELDVLDTVCGESEFTGDFNGLVLHNEIKYDGTLFGKAVLKRR